MNELMEIDPGTLIIGANIRTDTKLDKPFLASIAEHGVKQPIQAYRDGDALVVVAGQRRTLAAVQAQLPLVKVEVIDRPDDAGRIVDQVTENDQRADMNNGERMRAFEQLALLGVSAASIVKKTGHSAAVVKAGIEVAGNAAAAAALVEHELDLVDAAALVEFADDPALMEQLAVDAENGRLKWSLQRARDDRERNRKYAEAFEAAKATGITVLEKRPETYSGPIAGLNDLSNGPGMKAMTPSSHKKCPGHAAFINEEYNGGNSKMVPKFVCLDFKKHGHTPVGFRAINGGRDTSPAGKAERAEVIAGNRDWKTAIGVRRTWLRQFLAARTPPPTAAGFIALSMATDSVVADARLKSWNATAQYLLGVIDEWKPSGYETREAFNDLIAKANEKRALVIALGIVLGAYEAALMGHEWRGTGYSSSKPAARYFAYLQLLGYELSPIERRACGEVDDKPELTDSGAEE